MGLCFYFILLWRCKLQIPKSLRKRLRTYFASKYRYFNTLIILLTNASSMLILLYSGDCGQSPVPKVGLRTGTAVIQQEVYTGSDCALEYWVAYCGKGNHREGMKTLLCAHANIHRWFNEPISKGSSQWEEVPANITSSRVVPGGDGKELRRSTGGMQNTQYLFETHKKSTAFHCIISLNTIVFAFLLLQFLCSFCCLCCGPLYSFRRFIFI